MNELAKKCVDFCLFSAVHWWEGFHFLLNRMCGVFFFSAQQIDRRRRRTGGGGLNG